MKMTSQTNKLLVERAVAGEYAATEQLLAALQPKLFRFCMQMCRHQEDAEDVMQETMMAMARSLPSFKGESSVSTWMYIIARRFCYKQHANNQRNSASQYEELYGDSTGHSRISPADLVQQVETWESVSAAIKKLSPNFREVFVLRDIEELSAKEVASVIGIGERAVKSRLHRARAKLRELLTGIDDSSRRGCPNIRQEYSRHLENELSSEFCNRLQEHIGSCSACKRECDGLRSMLGLCSAATCFVPEKLQKMIHERLRAISDSFGTKNN